DACSASSSLHQRPKGVDEKSVSVVPPSEIIVSPASPASPVFPPSPPSPISSTSIEALVSTRIPFFALYGGRFSSQTLVIPLTIASKNSGGAPGDSRKSVTARYVRALPSRLNVTRSETYVVTS